MCPTRGALWTEALVGVLPVLAGPPVPAGPAQALVDVAVTQAARVPRPAVAGVGGQAVLTGAVVAGPREALVYVGLAVPPAVA